MLGYVLIGVGVVFMVAGIATIIRLYNQIEQIIRLYGILNEGDDD